MLGQNTRFFMASRIYVLSAIFHFVPLLLGADDGGQLALVGVIILLLAMALSRGYLGGVVFVFAAFGLSAGLYGFMTTDGLARWAHGGIMVADAMTAIALFPALWRGRDAV